MHFFARHCEKIRQSAMSSRLLWPCLLLVVLLVLTFGAALFLFASLHNTKKDTTRSLEIQFSVFQNDMERYFDQLAVMGVNLSEDMSAEVDKELALRQMSFFLCIYHRSNDLLSAARRLEPAQLVYGVLRLYHKIL